MCRVYLPEKSIRFGLDSSSRDQRFLPSRRMLLSLGAVSRFADLSAESSFRDRVRTGFDKTIDDRLLLRRLIVVNTRLSCCIQS